MNKKEFVALGCAGLVLWEAGDFALTGEKPPLPAGQPHIHAPTANMSQSMAYGGYVAFTTSSASTGISGSWVTLPISQGRMNEPPVVVLPSLQFRSI